MVQSKSKTNQRLIDMIRIKYAHQVGIKIGFNRFNQSDDDKIDDMEEKFVSQQIGRSVTEIDNYTL